MKKIAVIEDDNILREILSDKLSAAGYEVVGASDGDEALEVVINNKPDLILLDVLLPKKSGTDVLSSIKANSDLKDVPVIAISNTAEGDEIEKVKALGVKDFLVKAIFDSNDVVSRVQGVLGKEATPAPAEGATATSANTASTPSNNASKKVLIIEDDKFLRELAAQKLEKEGFSVAGATNGQEGLDLLESEKPNVIILDLILPGMDGFETLRKIRTESNFKTIPVIILSNLGQEEDIEKAKSLGATDYLIKAHFSFGEIIKKINEVVG